VEYHLSEKLSKMAKAWFKRACRGGSFSVRLRGEVADDTKFRDFMKIFRRHARETHSLELDMMKENLKQMDSSATFAQLRKLSICHVHENYHHLDGCLTMFHNTPMLRATGVRSAKRAHHQLYVPARHLPQQPGYCLPGRHPHLFR
jgi:hypothetical protein